MLVSVISDCKSVSSGGIQHLYHINMENFGHVPHFVILGGIQHLCHIKMENIGHVPHFVITGGIQHLYHKI